MRGVSQLLIRLLVAFLMCLPLIGAAQQAAVYLDATAQDPVGQQLVYQVREALRKSAGLKLVDLSSDAFWNLRIVTLDPYSHGPASGQSTVYSAVITMRALNGSGEYYDTHFVGICSVPSACAQNIVAAVDKEAVEFRRALLESLPKTH